MTYNIISIDGGPAGLIPVLALQEIEKACPGFLARTSLFAGTSSGAMTSILLAKVDDPAVQLPRAAFLWNNPAKLDHNNLLGYLNFLIGMGALNSTKYMKEFLYRPDMMGTVKMSELKKKVVAVSYRVSPNSLAPAKMFDWTWKSKVFNNFGGPEDPDYHLIAADVAIASGSAPLFAPVFMGYVDGGVTANNPTMCALVQVMREARPDVNRKPDAAMAEDLRNVRLLSFGAGRYELPIKPYANWGYYQWLLNPAHPLAVVETLLQGGADAVNFQARTLLSTNGFYRFDPKYAKTNTAAPHSSPQDQVATMNSRSTKEMVEQMILWVKACGWMEGSRPAPSNGNTIPTKVEAPAKAAPAERAVEIVEEEPQLAAAASVHRKEQAKRAPGEKPRPAKSASKHIKPVTAT